MHVGGAADALRRLGHEVTVLAPSSRARDLVAGRRALQRGAVHADVIAVGPSIPLSRRTNMGVPVAVRANLRLALTRGRFDIVHGFEPGLPSLSYLALTSAHVDRRDVLLPSTASSTPRGARDRPAANACRRAPRDLRETAEAQRALRGVTTADPRRRRRDSFPARSEARARGDRARVAGRATTRALLRLSSRAPRAGGDPSPYEATRLSACDRDGCARVHVRSTRTSAQRAEALATAAIFVSAPGGAARAQAAACGARTSMDPPTAPSMVERLVADARARASMARATRTYAEARASTPSGAELDAVYSKLARKRRVPRSEPDDPLADRDWISVDLHLHTEWSHDCSIPTEDVLDHAEAIGLGGIAVTDHNVFGGALEAIERARTRDPSSFPERRSRRTTRAR